MGQVFWGHFWDTDFFHIKWHLESLILFLAGSWGVCMLPGTVVAVLWLKGDPAERQSDIVRMWKQRDGKKSRPLIMGLNHGIN